MAIDHLYPEDDEFLSPNEIIRRLKREFGFVEIDNMRGRRGVSERIAYLRKLKAKGKNPFGPPIDDQIEYLESLMDDACHIVIADSQEPGDALLSTTVLPGEALSFGYYSPANQEASRSLLERCSRVLGYEISDE